jgi:hypothetical protein
MIPKGGSPAISNTLNISSHQFCPILDFEKNFWFQFLFIHLFIHGLIEPLLQF